MWGYMPRGSALAALGRCAGRSQTSLRAHPAEEDLVENETDSRSGRGRKTRVPGVLEGGELHTRFDATVIAEDQALLLARSWLGAWRRSVSTPQTRYGRDTGPCRLRATVDLPALEMPFRTKTSGSPAAATGAGTSHLTEVVAAHPQGALGPPAPPLLVEPGE